jgi:DNA-binding ferritin-like protein
MKNQFLAAFTSFHKANGAAHLAHWNVTGMLFFQFHGLFERVYTTLDGHEDSFAEQARGEGIEIPASVFNSVPELDWETPKDLVSEVLDLIDEYKSDLEDLHSACETKKNLGFINLIEGFLTDLNTLQFLLRATLDEL